MTIRPVVKDRRISTVLQSTDGREISGVGVAKLEAANAETTDYCMTELRAREPVNQPMITMC
jgi:hypothetical protein